MTTKPRINECFADWKTNGGIFTALQTFTTVPWYEDDIAAELDRVYYSMQSGKKYASPLVRELLSDDGTLTEASKLLIATSLLAIYGANWAKEWATMSFEYNPVENYSMVETMTDDETVTEFGHVNTREDDLTHQKTGTDTVTPDLETDNAVYGFNSAAAVPSGKSEQTGTSETEYNTTDTDSGSVTDTESGQNTQTRNYELTRSGNIGVTTSQQMIESERQLWVWNYFYNVVFPDIDKMITLKIY